MKESGAFSMHNQGLIQNYFVRRGGLRVSTLQLWDLGGMLGNFETSNIVTNGNLNALLSSALYKLQSKLSVLASSRLGMTIQQTGGHNPIAAIP